MNSTNIKIIIFISLLIIYLLSSEYIIEKFTTTATTTKATTTCPNYTIPLPTISISSAPEFSSINSLIDRNINIQTLKRNNLNDVNKKYGCVQNNYVNKLKTI